MRFARSLSLLLLLAAPLAAQARKPAKPADPDKPVKGGGSRNTPPSPSKAPGWSRWPWTRPGFMAT